MKKYTLRCFLQTSVLAGIFAPFLTKAKTASKLDENKDIRLFMCGFKDSEGAWKKFNHNNPSVAGACVILCMQKSYLDRNRFDVLSMMTETFVRYAREDNIDINTLRIRTFVANKSVLDSCWVPPVSKGKT